MDPAADRRTGVLDEASPLVTNFVGHGREQPALIPPPSYARECSTRHPRW